MDERTRVNDRAILTQRFLAANPNLDPDQVADLVAEYGTVHEQNEALGRSGSRYFPLNVNGVWKIGPATIGSDSDPAVRVRVRELNVSGATPDEAIQRAITAGDVQEVDTTQGRPRTGGTNRVTQVRPNPRTRNLQINQMVSEPSESLAARAGQATGNAARAAGSGVREASRVAGETAGGFARAGSSLGDAVVEAGPVLVEGIEQGAAVVDAAVREGVENRVNTGIDILNTVRERFNPIANAAQDIGDEFVSGFRQEEFNRPDIPVNVIDPVDFSRQPEFDQASLNADIISQIDRAIEAFEGPANTGVQPEGQGVIVQSPVPAEGVATGVVGRIPTADTSAVTGSTTPVTPSGPSLSSQAEQREQAQRAAFGELAVDIDPTIEQERQRIREAAARNEQRALENNTLVRGNVAQNALERIRPGTAFSNLDSLSQLNANSFRNPTQILQQIRGIGAGTKVPQVSDLQSLVNSQRQVEDTLRKNAEFLEDPSRLELSARINAVDRVNEQRRLVGLEPIAVEDTINPEQRFESFLENRDRAQTAGIIPDASESLLENDQQRTKLIESETQLAELEEFARREREASLDRLARIFGADGNSDLRESFRSIMEGRVQFNREQ